MNSDSSDEENLNLLREAADFQFINDSMFNDKCAEPVISTKNCSKQEKLPSLRKSQDDDEQFNFFHVTPGFQSYVARHLSNLLEKRLQKDLKTVDDIEEPQKKKIKSCVKLFSDSKYVLKIRDKHDIPVNLKKPNIDRPSKKKSDIEVSEDILKQIAVSPEDILNKTDTKFWSNRSKSKVFNYKRTSDGTLTFLEPKFE